MNLFKSIGKSVKKIFSGIGKAFKKVVKSKLGKALLIGAAIFVGGAMLGAWQGPAWLTGGGSGAAATTGAEAASGAMAATEAGAAATTGAGTLASGTAAAETAATASAAAEGAGLVSAAAPEAVVAGAGGGGAANAGLVTDALGAGAGAGGGAANNVAAFKAAVEAGATPASAAKAFGVTGLEFAPAKTGLAAFAANNPMLAYGGMMVGGQMLAGAMAPDPYEEYVKQREYERRSSNYGGVYGDGRVVDIQIPSWPSGGLVTQARGA